MSALSEYDIARARAMLVGYDARWGGEQYKVLAVESEFRAPLVNPGTGARSRTWVRGGKIDVITEDVDGKCVIVEHKTSSEDISTGSVYWRKLRMDGQISSYFLGAEALGFAPRACVYDVLAKPGVKPLKATPPEVRKYTKEGKLYAAQREEDETVDAYYARVCETIAEDPGAHFARGEVVRLEADMNEAMFDDWQTACQLREGANAGRFPRNPDACSKWGSECKFFDVCTGADTIENRTRFVKSDQVNPELTGGGDEAVPVLTSSRLRAGRSCQRLHRYTYLDGYRPVVESENLSFGSLIHLGLQAWWSAQDGTRLDAALAVLTQPKET